MRILCVLHFSIVLCFRHHMLKEAEKSHISYLMFCIFRDWELIVISDQAVDIMKTSSNLQSVLIKFDHCLDQSSKLTR